LKLKILCEENHLTEVAIPKIGCGTDQLEWAQVRAILRYILRNSTIKIIAFTKDNLKEDKKLKIIAEYHNTPSPGHHGVERIYNRLKTSYLWKSTKQHVKEYIKRCPTCQVCKTSNRYLREPMIITTTSSYPFVIRFMDIVGLLLAQIKITHIS